MQRSRFALNGRRCVSDASDSVQVSDSERGVRMRGSFYGAARRLRARHANIAVAADGSMVIKPAVEGERTVESRPVLLPIVRVLASGRVDTLHVLELRGVAVPLDLGGRQALVRQPLPFTPKNDVAAGGRLLAVVEQSPPRGSAGAVFRLTVKDDAGRVVVRRSVSYTPVPVPAAWRDSVIASFAKVRPADAAAGRQLGAQLARTLEFPSSFPPVERVLVGGDGTIWVRPGGTGATARWSVYDASANPLGRVRLPSSMRLLYATRRLMLASGTSEDDEPILVRYDVASRSASRR